MANLINSGIIPMTFENEADYDEIDMDDELVIENAREQIKNGSSIVVKNVTKGKDIKVMLLVAKTSGNNSAGGLLNYTRQQNQ